MALSLLVAVWIFWFLYKDIKMQSLLEAIQQANFFWILFSVVVSIYGYWLRAWRWKLLLEAEDSHRVTTQRTFLATMLGYLANLLVPRAGEIARCGVLKKTDDIPMGNSIGTVILERSIDLLFMVGVIFLGFLLEREVFLNLISTLISPAALWQLVLQWIPLAIGTVIMVGILVYWLFHKYRDHGFIKKIRHFIRDFVTGLKSVRQLKNQSGFWISSVVIWIIYFLMMYAVALAIPSTANLSPSSVLMVMVMGSIGMVAPVQGGIGTFHALVAFILIGYGIAEDQSKIFAAIVHGSQVLTVLIMGGVSLVIFSKISSTKQLNNT